MKSFHVTKQMQLQQHDVSLNVKERSVLQHVLVCWCVWVSQHSALMGFQCVTGSISAPQIILKRDSYLVTVFTVTSSLSIKLHVTEQQALNSK